MRAAELNPRVLHTEAATLCLLGLMNTAGLYFEAKSGARIVFGGRVAIAGVVQLLNAYSNYKAYPVYSDVYAHLDRSCLHELVMKIGDAWERKGGAGEDMTEFKIGGKKCTAKFAGELVILLIDGSDVVISERAESKIESSHDKLLSKARKVELSLGDDKFKTEMSSACHERWQAWLAASEKSAMVV
jgi:hypothetical protein